MQGKIPAYSPKLCISDFPKGASLGRNRTSKGLLIRQILPPMCRAEGSLRSDFTVLMISRIG